MLMPVALVGIVLCSALIQCPALDLKPLGSRYFGIIGTVNGRSRANLMRER
jgi:hypothetical protein